ncbi:MAG: FecR family protein [Balneolaceae bacterium]|nr:MAG: FecR family protein [Balneolaceae bacterium]
MGVVHFFYVYDLMQPQDKEQNTHQIWYLIARHLEGTLSHRESKRFRDWLNRNKENRRILRFAEQIWENAALPIETLMGNDIDPEDDWKILMQKIDAKREFEKNKRVAAYRKIRQRQIYFSNFLKIAALFLVAAMSVLITLHYAPSTDSADFEPVYRVVSTNAGEKANIDLGDGTKVFLNSESRIDIPEVFLNSQRYVRIEGNAYFSVVKDEKRPFIIETEHAIIRVIGTEFDLRSYPDENEVRVAVKNGSISMNHILSVDEEIYIDGGKLGRLNIDNGMLEVEIIENMDIYSGWLEGRLIFRDMILESVFTQLKRWYNVEIIYELSDISLLENEFTAELRMRTIDDVFNVIAMAMDFQYIKNEFDQIIIKN